MTSKKIYQVGFVLLLLINATLIFLLVKQSPRPPMNHGSREGSIIEKISTQLDLTEKQVINYRIMAEKHREQMRGFEEDQRELIKAFFQTLNNTSNVSTDSIKSQILKIESEKLQYTYDHFKELKSILNEEQKAKYELIIKDILAVLIGERNNSRPPPRGRDRGSRP